MTDYKEDVCPLSPANVFPASDASASASDNNNNKNTLRRVKCLTCVVVTSLILLTIALTLVFTVFKVKDPIIKVNGVKINGQDSATWTPIQFLGRNISMIVDVSVKNPNTASFKYSNTTTDIYYKGTVVGEVVGPPGKARARRTSRMNVTVNIRTDRIFSDPGLVQEVIGSGLVSLWSYTKVSGKVKIMGLVDKHVTVKMNCTMGVKIASQAIQDIECKKKIDF